MLVRNKSMNKQTEFGSHVCCASTTFFIVAFQLSVWVTRIKKMLRYSLYNLSVKSDLGNAPVGIKLCYLPRGTRRLGVWFGIEN